MLPGPGVKGAVRAVHEALCDSCLRVVDVDYVPTHRTPVTSDMVRGWTMAVVADVSGGLPQRVAPCSQTVRVRASGPRRVLRDRVWSTGDRFDIPAGAIERDIALDVTPNLTGGQWVLLVTDTRARPDRDTRTNKATHVWFSAGRLGDPTRPVPVTDRARLNLARELDGAEDLQTRNKPAERADEFANVYWRLDAERQPTGTSEVIGRRRLVPTVFEPGFPLWVQVQEVAGVRQVTDIRLSRAWRARGDVPGRQDGGSIAARIGDAAPCVDPEWLCPTCCMFGSGGDEDALPGEQLQRAYRGHVRFADAVADSECLSDEFVRAPLASPKPSAGQFYLDNNQYEGRTDAQPLAFWGSQADRGQRGVRPIRGRKFYWRTRPEGGWTSPGRQRSQRQPHHQEPQDSDRVQVAEPGSTFSTRVSFDGLAKEQLGSLLCALAPHLLFGEGHVLPLGGGKPFGWGSVDARIEEFVAQDAGHRYLGAAAPVITLEDCVAAFAAGFDRPGHTALQHLLAMGYVDDDQVHYPADLTDPLGEPSFTFWSRTRGQSSDRLTWPLRSLPDPAGPPAAQRMTVEEE